MVPLYILVLIIIIIYNTFIYKYFRLNEQQISYDVFLKHFFHVIDEENYYMNYGLWDAEHTTLHQANANLVNFIFTKAGLKDKKGLSVLDVGCGYGHQDFEWERQLDPSCSLKAVDISAKQIYYAIEKAHKQKSAVTFDICDALFIDQKYKNETFDVILSLESAFHYPDRPKFFKNVKALLNSNDGTFVITDLLLKQPYTSMDWSSKIFLKFFSDFLCIPPQNLITAEEWDAQLAAAELSIQEIHDTSDQTFSTYYTYFMTTFIEKKGLPEWLAQALVNFFCAVQPFAYRIAVCKSVKE
jgi:cyclopropane fatty-acyl-phospholipid synthase-like methyltransferase